MVRSPATQLLRFLKGEAGVSDAVLVALHQAALPRELIARLVAAARAGAPLARDVETRGRNIRDIVLDPAFAWTAKQAVVAPASAVAKEDTKLVDGLEKTLEAELRRSFGTSLAVVATAILVANRHHCTVALGERMRVLEHPAHGDCLSALLFLAQANKPLAQLLAEGGVHEGEAGASPLDFITHLIEDQIAADGNPDVLLQLIHMADQAGVTAAVCDRLRHTASEAHGNALNALMRTIGVRHLPLFEGGPKAAQRAEDMLAYGGVRLHVEAAIVALTKTQRMARAIELSGAALPREMVDQIVGLIPGLATGWALSHLFGPGVVVDLVAIGLVGQQVVQVAADVLAFYNLSSEAKTEDDLTCAGRHFAKVIATVGVAGLIGLFAIHQKQKANGHPGLQVDKLSAGIDKLVGPKPVVASPAQHQYADLWVKAPEVAEKLPHLASVADANTPAVSRVNDMVDDFHLQPETRDALLEELRVELAKLSEEPKDLHKFIGDIVQGNPGRYSRQGYHPTVAELRELGGLRRAISIKSVMATLTSDAWYALAVEKINAQELGSASVLPIDRSKFRWELHANIFVTAYRLGVISCRVEDLHPGALIQGARPGTSAWLFSAKDAGPAVTSPEAMMSQLAVGPEYADGYLLIEVAPEVAVAHGAAKPGALDLTLSTAGRMAPRGEAVGRTAPFKAGQVPVREVVIAPIAVSSVSRMAFIRGTSP